jgi:16S rRNA (guanine527-N7)-methyltransferase
VTPLEAVAPYAEYCSRSAGDVAAELEKFRALLVKWQPAQNLVSRETLDTFWTRHAADSLQLLPLVRATDQQFLDLGSGGGLPGIPLAIALRRRHTLVDANARKASFLRTVARELALSVTVVPQRIGEVDSRETPDVVTARALAPLPELLGMIAPLSGPQTRAILHKGREYREELRAASHAFAFDVIEHQSRTESGSVLLEIANLRPISVR